MNTNKKWSPSTSSVSDRWIQHFSFYLSNTSTFSVDLILCHLSLESPIAPPLIDHPQDHFILLWFLVHCITETAVCMQIQWCLFLFFVFTLHLSTISHSHSFLLWNTFFCFLMPCTWSSSYLTGCSFLGSFHWLLTYFSTYKYRGA